MGTVYAGLGFASLFATIAFAIMILVTQCITALQGTEAWNEMQRALQNTKRSTFMPSSGYGGDQWDTRLWFALRRAPNLPANVQRKVKMIAFLYEAERVIFYVSFIGALCAVIFQL